MTVADPVVLDASVFVRAIVDPDSDAARRITDVESSRTQAHVPELVLTEVANALLRYVRASALTAEDGARALDGLEILPLHVHGRALVGAAFATALEDGLSAYDASYVALARSLDATLVTGDRRLASAVPGSELIA